MRGIAIRQELTAEWKDRGITEEVDFAILANEISKATFGKTVQEYKKFKGLQKKNQNLRDHMTDWELILSLQEQKINRKQKYYSPVTFSPIFLPRSGISG